MTAASAFFRFFNGFGIPAYPATSVPDKAEYPYITYNLQFSSFDMGDCYIDTNVWYKTESEKEPTDKTMEIDEAIGRSGYVLSFDNGFIWIKKANPFIQVVPDEDNSIKRRSLNIIAEYLS